MTRRPRRVNTFKNFAREFNPGYYSAANRSARRAYTAAWFARAGRVGAGIGAVAAAAAANLFTRVPKLDTRPVMEMVTPRRFGGKGHRDGTAVEAQTGGTAQGTTDAAGYVQVQRFKNVVGKALIRQERINRMVEAALDTRIDRFQYLGTTGGNNGPFFVDYALSGTAPNRVALYPMYLFDLTSLWRQFQTANQNPNPPTITWQYSLPFMRLAGTEGGSGAPDTITYDWTTINGKTNAAVDSKTWTPERISQYDQPTATGLSFPDATYGQIEKAFFEWADIRMTMWGAKTKPSWLEVSLVRFSDDEYAPPSWVSSVADGGVLAQQTQLFPLPTDTLTKGKVQRFYSSLLDRLLGTETLVRGQAADAAGKIETIWSKRFNFNPSSNFEDDPAGHQQILKLFYNMDMVCDFNHGVVGSNTSDPVSLANQQNSNIWPQADYNASLKSVLRNKKSRVFLMVKGLDCGSGAGTVAANSASFDLCVRRKFTQIA